MKERVRVFEALACLAVLCLPLLVLGQTAKSEDVWKPFGFFLGQWKGQGESGSGKGDYERSYARLYEGRFIEVHNQSTYPPSKENPKGEVHKDFGIISYDKIRKTFVLRQFHIEGFVNQYKLESISPDGKTIVFASEAIENIPAGWRAKETYRILGADEFSETFELAEPDKGFEPYSTAVFKRVK